jgi:hypothetical protein
VDALRESILDIFRSLNHDNIRDNHIHNTLDTSSPMLSVRPSSSCTTPYADSHPHDEKQASLYHHNNKFNPGSKNGQQAVDEGRNEVNESNSPIKGILDRFRPTHGVVFVAFHDMRDAQKVKAAVDARGASLFSDLEEKDHLGNSVRLTCEYITAEKLGEVGCISITAL